MKVSVKVPATIANLGPGFDSFGLALPLYNIVSVEETVLPGSGIQINIINEKNNDKKIIVDRVELINAIERVAIMVNDRTNVVKFNFTANQLEIMADTPDAGKSKDYIDIEYSYDDMLTAFNYKFVLDALKNMDSKNIEIEISDVLAASIFKPQDDEGNYICLIMPVKV